ncbi:MAG: sRNA-binding carbon storage regulator CsrA, partial [Arenicella sp.]
MIINLQKQNESAIITLDDGEDIEFTQEDLASIGINAEKAIEMMKDELLEKLLP